jgi:hypothetical protein
MIPSELIGTLSLEQDPGAGRRILRDKRDCTPQMPTAVGAVPAPTNLTETRMGDVVNFHKFDLGTDLGHAFVVDATRAAEGLITDKELTEKYELSPADWRAITKDKALGNAVRAERERRVRTGRLLKKPPPNIS